MTNSEKLEKLKLLISPDTANDNLLSSLLEGAEGVVLNRRYPFGFPEGTEVPKKFENVQLRIAVEMFSKMGAEGQTDHSENGISRKWESGDVSRSLLRQITPLCGSVEA